MEIRAGFIMVDGFYFPLTIDLETHPHWILNGGSGSGKSILLLYLLNSLLNYPLHLFICDPKGSGDFEGLSRHYACYDDCADLVEKVYERYRKIKTEKTGEKIVLLIDEYAAFILNLENKDKKRASSIKNKISELLMQGRHLPGNGSVAVWVVTQRADAEYFPKGARLNFMVSIGMGRLDPQSKAMLFPGEEIPEYIPQRGTGLILADGEPLRVFQVPFIEVDRFKKFLKEKARRRNNGSVVSPSGGST